MIGGSSLHRLLIEICTKDRDTVLGQHFAALINQSYQDWDLVVINDGREPVGRGRTTGYLLDIIRKNHEVDIYDGTHISQAHNHNMILYKPYYASYKEIYRSDDDILEDAFALERMLKVLDSDESIACVGGLWFEQEYIDEVWHDRGELTWQYDKMHETAGRVGTINSNWQQRLYHSPKIDAIQVEHVYSNCIYRAEAMRRVGGWPEVYSRGVAHGEETDGTYRLHLAGYKLYIATNATGQHLKTSGGIRSAKNVNEAQYMDRMKWQDRLPLFQEINFKPTVAVWCQHAFGLGGAQRHFYQTVNLLQQNTDLVVHPIFTSGHFTPEECLEAFGFTYEMHEPLDSYDVCLSLGHQPFEVVEAKHYIGYIYFPDKTELPFDDFDALVGISKYTAEWIGNLWGYKASHIYPAVKPIEPVSGAERSNIILCVSRLDPHKAPMWLMEQFMEWGHDDWEFRIVAASTGGVFYEYEEQCRAFAKKHDRIHIHEDISEAELHYMYRSAKVLWAAKGIYAENNPKEAEHFGLTPIEAWSAGCIPVVYDKAGYRETTHESLRWKTVDELHEITERVMEHGPVERRPKTLTFAYGDEGTYLPAGLYDIQPVNIERYWEKFYVRDLENLIRRVNAMALELERVEQISLEDRKIRVAAIADSPRLTTGFAAVAREIYKGILGQDDMELFVFGLMDHAYPLPEEKMPYAFRPSYPDDPQGKKTAPDFVRWCSPDVIFELYDPGGAMGHVNALKALGNKIPMVVYFPVEGYPISRAAYRLVQAVDYPVTYCESGAKAIRKFFPNSNVVVAPHGIDHEDFNPLDPKIRQKLRELVGWDDKFIVMNVGSNKRVKQQPYLIDTMRILLERGHDDIYMYLHTRAFDDHIMQGWTLDWIRDLATIQSGLPVDQHILFPSLLGPRWMGVPYKYGDDEQLWRMSVPPSAKLRGQFFASLDFITRYCLADLYVDVSSAEGFGLPPLEAAACGVPVISVDDGMVRSEIHSKYCYMVKPRHWTTWHTSARLALVNPHDVANAILDVKNNDELRDRLIGRCANIREELSWEPTRQIFVDLIREAAHARASKQA
jgi:glycosyltransferase involved in cell wall biosynthesis